MNLKKKLLTIILLICVFFPCIAVVSACGEKNNGGSGSSSIDDWTGKKENSWCIIENANDFINFVNIVNSGKMLNCQFRLDADIDFKEDLGYEYVFNGIGGGTGKYHYYGDYDLKLKNCIEKYAFAGKFDGNNHKISNFVINQGFYFSAYKNIISSNNFSEFKFKENNADLDFLASFYLNKIDPNLG